MAEEFHTLYEAKGTLDVRLEATKVERPPGNVYLHHRLVVGDGRPGVVVAAHSANGLLFVRSARVSTGEDLWELPRGSSEIEDAQGDDDYSDATLIRAGLRELKEEAGYSAQNPRVLGRYYTDTAVFPQRIGAVTCKVDADSALSETDGEVDEIRWIAADQLGQMIRDGFIRDSHTLSLLALLSASPSN